MNMTIAELWEHAATLHAQSDACLRMANMAKNKQNRSHLLVKSAEWQDAAEATAWRARIAQQERDGSVA